MRIIIGLLRGQAELVVETGPPLSFDLSRFDLDAIPYGLSFLNRFGGQVGPYSVCQHSLILSRIVGGDPLMKAAALIHDAGEGLGAGDTNTFLKRALGACRLSEYEDGLCEVIWQHEGLPGTFAERMEKIHRFDKALGTEEAEAFGLPVSEYAPRLDWGLAQDVQFDVLRWCLPLYQQKLWWEAWNDATGRANPGATGGIVATRGHLG